MKICLVDCCFTHILDHSKQESLRINMCLEKSVMCLCIISQNVLNPWFINSAASNNMVLLEKSGAGLVYDLFELTSWLLNQGGLLSTRGRRTSLKPKVPWSDGYAWSVAIPASIVSMLNLFGYITVLTVLVAKYLFRWLLQSCLFPSLLDFSCLLVQRHIWYQGRSCPASCRALSTWTRGSDWISRI